MGRRDSQSAFRKELSNRDFTLEPKLNVIVKNGRRRHHPGDRWRRLQMHQHVAPAAEQDRVVARQVVRLRDRTRRSQCAGFHYSLMITITAAITTQTMITICIAIQNRGS